jgi:hypothetical protein
METWSAEVTIDTGDLTSRQIEALTGASPTIGAITYDRATGTARVSLTIEGGDAWAATGQARAAVEAMAHALGREVPVIGVRVHPAGHDPIRLDLVGYAEIAAMADPPLSRQRARQVAEDNPRFPDPVGATANGPVYLREAVQQFLQTWERKPGRARKA